jgi:hypothetical protein
MKCYQSWARQVSSLKNVANIDSFHGHLIKVTIMERIIYIIQYLAKMGLAFRRNANRLHESCNGKFRKLWK